LYAGLFLTRENVPDQYDPTGTPKKDYPLRAGKISTGKISNVKKPDSGEETSEILSDPPADGKNATKLRKSSKKSRKPLRNSSENSDSDYSKDADSKSSSSTDSISDGENSSSGSPSKVKTSKKKSRGPKNPTENPTEKPPKATSDPRIKYIQEITAMEGLNLTTMSVKPELYVRDIDWVMSSKHVKRMLSTFMNLFKTKLDGSLFAWGIERSIILEVDQSILEKRLRNILQIDWPQLAKFYNPSMDNPRVYPSDFEDIKVGECADSARHKWCLHPEVH
jgi:hypothetical protein